MTNSTKTQRAEPAAKSPRRPDAWQVRRADGDTWPAGGARETASYPNCGHTHLEYQDALNCRDSMADGGGNWLVYQFRSYERWTGHVRTEAVLFAEDHEIYRDLSVGQPRFELWKHD